MKVCELITLLQQHDPDAVECAIYGVTTRAAVRALDPDDDAEVDSRGRVLHDNDVFIVEGEQLRYGTSAAWEACRR